jgi:cysteine synthase A
MNKRGCEDIMLAEHISDLIGNTPLLKVEDETSGGAKAEIYAKLESFNPLSSVKDRIAVAMVDDAEAKGALKPGATIIEPTSGNTGVGLAFVAASRGYRLILTMPESMSEERRKILRVLGAELVLTPAAEGMKGAIEEAEALHKENPGSVMMRQFNNPANPAIHEKTTAEEIWADMRGQIDVFIAGVGTGGTLTGTARGLKKKDEAIRVVAVEPLSSAVLSGQPAGAHRIQGIGAGFVPEVLDTELIDEIIPVSDQEAAEAARELAKSKGILAGISSGAALVAARRIAKENPGKRIVTLFPDTGERYLSTWIFEGV